ncbi:hypothetical protein D3C72_1148360 [compost metagenome]
MKAGRIERRLFLADDAGGDLDHVGVRLHRRNIVEEVVGVLHLVVSAQGVGDQSLAVDLEGQLPLLAAQHQLTQGDLARALHRLTDHGEGFDPHALFRHHIEGVVPVEPVDIRLVDELIDGDGLRAFQPHLVEVGLVEQDVFVLGHLIALDQIGPLDRAGVRVRRHHADAVVGGRIDQVKAHVAGAAGRSVEGDRTGHQRQLQMPLPGRPRRHVPLLSP